MQKLKIALITSVVDNRGGRGTALVARRFLERLSTQKTKFEITLIHHEHVSDPLYGHYPELVIPHLPQPFDRQMFREAVFWARLWFKGYRFDVIHFLHPRVWPSYLLAPGRHVVITAFEAGVMLNLTKPTLGDRLFQLTNRFLHGRMSCVIASSRFGKSEIEKEYGLSPEKVVQIPLGVDSHFAPRDVSEKEVTYLRERFGIMRPYILSVARLDPHKNIHRLIEAFWHIHTELPTLQLVLVGGKHMPEYSQHVLDLIKQKGLTKIVHIAPFIPDEDMPLVYSAAELFTYPSYHEGFGLPILEAMACGVPVTTANTTASPETAGDAAVLYDPYNIDNMANAMLQVLKDDHLKIALVEKGLLHAKKYRWDDMAQQIFTLYEKKCLEK